MTHLVCISSSAAHAAGHPRAAGHAAATSATPIKDTSEIDVGALNGLFVLLVEDDPISRDALELILSYYGATVSSAGCVSDALQCFERRAPSIVVSDIGLPAADGYSLIRAIRARDRARGIATPAIAVSGYPSHESDETARQAGFDAFLRKPVDVRALLTLVAALATPPDR